MRDLATEFSAGVDGFDAGDFHKEVVAGLHGRELMERLEWIADCVAPRLSTDFDTMADQLEAAMPSRLDTRLQDDDFGRFIHAVPGILAVRHGLEKHRDRSLDLIYEATQRFSMEFYIRPFLNRWPDETMARLGEWAEDENYHVRRLVSEGTRPKLPWAKKLTLDPLAPLPFLDRLHADPTRYVTRSVANHLNDIAKISPPEVVNRLQDWAQKKAQSQKELDWMTRHATRTLVKQGDSDALALLGFRPDAPVDLSGLSMANQKVRIGEALEFSISLSTQSDTPVPVLVDYLITFARPNGRTGQKVYKLKQGKITPLGSLSLSKKHPLKGNATTFTLHPGPHRLAVQVNGRIVGDIDFELTAEA
ncbi:hypothetical protein [Shimia sp.]|uniref:hypothetical protein n=1 Tax=Shimia sp. TaxID=1954381 RepID=UPI003298B731